MPSNDVAYKISLVGGLALMSLIILWDGYEIVLDINNLNRRIFTILIGSITDIEAIIISYAALVISVFTFYASLSPDEFYFRISKRDIYKKYRLHTVYQILSLLLVYSIISTFYLQDFRWDNKWNVRILVLYEMCIISMLLLGEYAIGVIGILALGKKRIENHSLDKLYRILWTNEPIKGANRNDETIYANLGYLIKRYIKSYAVKYQIDEIEALEYLEEFEYDKKQYRKMLNSFIYDASQYRPSKKDRENARTNKLINNQEYYSNYIDREGFWKELVR